MGYKPGIRDKLIAIFVLIKVIPLVVLAWFAFNEVSALSQKLEKYVAQMAATSTQTTKQVSQVATTSSIRALDIRSREAIERLTTDTARQIAAFLKDRDTDIRTVSLLSPNPEIYQKFLANKKRDIVLHQPWVMNADGDQWHPENQTRKAPQERLARNKDNELDFHYRPPEKTGIARPRPLYLEISFVDLNGMEKIKVTTSNILSRDLKDISDPQNTYCRAEKYFKELQLLKDDEIYVSEVIGPYVKTHMIGPYTRQRAQKMGIAFHPEASAYAGKENPVGKRFQGLIRWGMPVVKNGQRIGYVTLALDHTHIMEFTDHIVPTEERYSPISDAASGNYAFLWDYKGRNISHPRDYFIFGYNPQTGEAAVPWMEQAYYRKFETSGETITRFLEQVPSFDHQALSKSPSKEMVKKGLVGLDCRYLNFAPQCDGWHNLTETGGSGSFVIHWSGLKKLTTAATIPYYTGRYKTYPRGFGYVTIGANVDEFHKPAITTAAQIKETENQFVKTIDFQNKANQDIILSSMKETATRLTFYTFVMVALVIAIAVMMASALTNKITAMINGISKFQRGEMGYRLDVRSADEMGELGRTFNSMADSVQLAMLELEKSKSSVEDSNVSLRLLLSNIIDSMPSIIIGVDTRARITLWNEEARQVTGKAFDQVEGKRVYEAFPLVPIDPELVATAVENGSVQKEERLETRINKEMYYYDITVYPLISDKIDGAVLRIDNVTTRVYMEEMMIQTEKMQSIGGLAAGMAHEINSPLAGIIQSAQVIRNRVNNQLPANIEAAGQVDLDLENLKRYFEKRHIYELLESILDAGKRAAGIVAGMLAFSRKSDATFSGHRIDKILDQTIDIVKKDYDIKKLVDFKTIDIVRDYQADLPEVQCDMGKIQQVFFNILKNGAQAMMKTSNLRAPQFSVSTKRRDDCVVVEIEDTGPGMADSVKNRIFEPFFTTKKVGIGTGLGLYISYFIVVENHKGQIAVHSTLGTGTRFVIELPFTQPD